MIVSCVQCGGPVVDDMIDVCRVTPIEAQEFPELKVGTIVCSMCMHITKWPETLARKRADAEDEPWGVTPRDWEDFL